MFKLMRRLFDISPVLFWVVYALIALAIAAGGLVFTYWAGKGLFEMIFK